MKAHRCNSMLYSQDKVYKLAEEIKISPQTLKKYLKFAKEKEILIPVGEHFQFINLNKLVQKLFPALSIYSTKYLSFFASFQKRRNYKYYIAQVEYAFADLNFKQQEYHIEYNKTLLERLDSPKLSKKDYNKALKKFKVGSLVKLKKCIRSSKKGVVTGKYHLSKLLGCSPSKAARLLSFWAKQGKFHRQIHNCFIPAYVCHENFDTLKNQGYKNIGTGKEGFYLNLGSSISSFNRIVPISIM